MRPKSEPLPPAMAARPLGLRPEILAVPDSRIVEVAVEALGRPDIVPLWFGEGDLPTPSFIADAAVDGLREGLTFYTDQRGIPPLRQALSAYLSRLHGAPVAERRIVVTSSGMNAIVLACQALLGPGDNMAIVSPVWPNIVAAVEIVGAEPRQVPLERRADGGWRLDLDRLFAACDGATRAIFVNSPSNPTGWVMRRDEIAALRAFAARRGLWIVADEVYARLVYDGSEAAPSFLEEPGEGERLIVVNSFSKNWAMTGWRLGWMVAPPDIVPTLLKLVQYNTSGAPAFLQKGALAALCDGEDFVRMMRERCRTGRDLVLQGLARFPRVRIAAPEGAFYAFFGVDGVADSLAFAKQVLRDSKVGLAPGSAFGPGGEGFLRLCFASTPERLSEGLRRLETVLGGS